MARICPSEVPGFPFLLCPPSRGPAGRGGWVPARVFGVLYSCQVIFVVCLSSGRTTARSSVGVCLSHHFPVLVPAACSVGPSVVSRACGSQVSVCGQLEAFCKCSLLHVRLLCNPPPCMAACYVQYIACEWTCCLWTYWRRGYVGGGESGGGGGDDGDGGGYLY